MPKKRYMIRAKCPQCACRDITFLGPDKLREKFVDDEKEIEVLCPFCGAKYKGAVYKEEKVASDSNCVQNFFMQGLGQ